MGLRNIKIVILLVLINFINIIIADDCDEIGVPTSFTAQLTGAMWVLTWEAPENSNDCFSRYQLILNVNREEVVNMETTQAFYVYNNIGSCYKATATVRAITITDMYGPEEVREVSDEIGVPELTLVVTSNLGVLTWTEPPDSESCDIYYNLKLTLDNKEVRDIEVNQQFYVLDDVKVCSVLEATLVAIATSGVQSDEVQQKTNTGVAQIANLNLNELTLNWDVTSKNAEGCQYNVMIDGILIGTTEETSFELPEDNIAGTPCTSTDVTVIPIFESDVGTAVTQPIDIPPAELEDIEVEETDEYVRISWSNDYGKCTIDVNIEDISESDLVFGENFADVEISKFKPCTKYSVAVQINYNNNAFGEPVIEEFIKKPEKLEDFQVTTTDAGDIIAEWSDNFENCIITFEIDNNEIDRNDIGTSETFDKDIFELCVNHEILAFASDDEGRNGESTTVTFKKSVDWSVDTFEVIQAGNNIIPSWSESFQKCYIQIIMRYGEIGLDLYDNDEIESALTSLDKTVYEYCTIYRALFIVFDNEDEYLLDQTEYRFEKSFSDDFDAVKDVTIQIQENNDGADVSFIAKLSWETDCELNYKISCSTDGSDDMDAENADSITENQYELTECPMDESTNEFIVTLIPNIDDKTGLEISCAYTVEYLDTEARLSFKLIDNLSNIAKCPDSETS